MPRRWPLAFLLVMPGPALAQEKPPLFADRPDFTESAAIIGRGRIQFEGGWTAQGDDRVGAHVFGAVIRTGISDGWEAWIEGTWIAMDDARGAEVTGRGDADLGLKRVLRHAAPTRALEVALLVSSSVPVGEYGIGERGWQPEARVLLDWEASSGVSLGVNGGAGLPLVGGGALRAGARERIARWTDRLRPRGFHGGLRREPRGSWRRGCRLRHRRPERCPRRRCLARRPRGGRLDRGIERLADGSRVDAGVEAPLT